MIRQPIILALDATFELDGTILDQMNTINFISGADVTNDDPGNATIINFNLGTPADPRHFPYELAEDATLHAPLALDSTGRLINISEGVAGGVTNVGVFVIDEDDAHVDSTVGVDTNIRTTSQANIEEEIVSVNPQKTYGFYMDSSYTESETLKVYFIRTDGITVESTPPLQVPDRDGSEGIYWRDMQWLDETTTCLIGEDSTGQWWRQYCRLDTGDFTTSDFGYEQGSGEDSGTFALFPDSTIGIEQYKIGTYVNTYGWIEYDPDATSSMLTSGNSVSTHEDSVTSVQYPAYSPLALDSSRILFTYFGINDRVMLACAKMTDSTTVVWGPTYEVPLQDTNYTAVFVDMVNHPDDPDTVYGRVYRGGPGGWGQIHRMEVTDTTIAFSDATIDAPLWRSETFGMIDVDNIYVDQIDSTTCRIHNYTYVDGTFSKRTDNFVPLEGATHRMVEGDVVGHFGMWFGEESKIVEIMIGGDGTVFYIVPMLVTFNHFLGPGSGGQGSPGTLDEWFGVAQEAGSSGETIDVAIEGGLSQGHTGLTKDYMYWMRPGIVFGAGYNFADGSHAIGFGYSATEIFLTRKYSL